MRKSSAPGGDSLALAAGAIHRARSVVALTGAGISAESGIPTFRGASGLWRRYSAEELATPQAFDRDPALVWEWYCWRREIIGRASPNAGHRALARFEQRLPSFAVLTQNVDGLHQRAGTTRLVELHGNIWRARCRAGCGRVYDKSPRTEGGPAVAEPARSAVGIPPRAEIPRCACGALLRPDVVWFGEALDPAAIHAAMQAVAAADVLLVVGTSATVHPVASLPALARRAGATIVEINPDETPLSADADIVLRGPAGSVLPVLEERA